MYIEMSVFLDPHIIDPIVKYEYTFILLRGRDSQGDEVVFELF